LIPWIYFLSIISEDDEMGNQACLDYYNSSSGMSGKICAKYENTDTLIIVKNESISGTMTLHNIINDADLENTSGHNLVVLLIINTTGSPGTNPTLKIRASNTLGTADGTVLKDHSVAHLRTVTTGADDSITVRVVVPTGKFITLEKVTNAITVTAGIVIEKT
jgi:hypothetical protein